jgi:hypothetical protein
MISRLPTPKRALYQLPGMAISVAALLVAAVNSAAARGLAALAILTVTAFVISPLIRAIRQTAPLRHDPASMKHQRVVLHGENIARERAALAKGAPHIIFSHFSSGVVPAVAFVLAVMILFNTARAATQPEFLLSMAAATGIGIQLLISLVRLLALKSRVSRAA